MDRTLLMDAPGNRFNILLLGYSRQGLRHAVLGGQDGHPALAYAPLDQCG